MYRSLAKRLTAWFVFVAVGMLALVAVLLTAFGFSIIARSENESIGAAAREAPSLVTLYAARHQTLKQAAPALVLALTRPGVTAIVFDERHEPLAGGIAGEREPATQQTQQNQPQPNQPNPQPSADSRRSARAAFAIGSLLGVRPQHIEVPGGEILIVPEPGRLQSILKSYALGLLPLLAVVGLLAWLLGRYITGQALRPLVAVTSALGALADGDFTPRLIAEGERGEFAELTGAYNRAAAQVSTAFQQRRNAEAEMRQFVADAGHELRTPLTVVMGYLDVLQRGAVDDPRLRARIFDSMTIESRRMRGLIDKLIVLARLEQPELGKLERVDAAEIAKDVVASYGPLTAANRIVLNANEKAYVTADRSELHEAMANLLDNALKYAPGAPIDISVEPHDDSVLLQVKDEGPGLSPDEQEHIFDRFYRGTNREDVGGSGLGLAIAKRAVERAKGTISVESRVGDGTRFTIRLPRAG